MKFVNHDTNVPFVRWRVLIVLCFALLSVMLANSSLNLALPAISEEMELTQLQLTWVVEAYALAFAGLLFIGSAVADRYGRKKVMQIGLVSFAIAAIYASFGADSGDTLVIARAAMGLAAAFVMPTTLSVVNVTFPQNERAKAIAIWGAIAGAGMMLGSVVSGILLEYFSWEATFLLSGLMAVVAVSLNQIFINESVDEKHTPIDWLGGLFVTAGLVGIVFTIMEAPNQDHWWTHGSIVAAAIIGVAGLVAFIIQELRTDHPMLDVRLFKNSVFAVSSGVLVLVFLALMGSFLNIGQILQLVLGYSAFTSSLLMMPVMIPMIAISPFVPKLVAKTGLKSVMLFGLGVIIAGMFVMSTWDANLTYWHVITGLGITLAGMAFVMTPATNLLMSEVPKNRSGMGSALNDTTRELGGALGVAILGSIISSYFTSSMNNSLANSGLPADIVESSSSSLAVATVVGNEMGATDLIIASHEAFLSAVGSAMHISIIITLITFTAAAIWLPKGVKELAEVHH